MLRGRAVGTGRSAVAKFEQTKKGSKAQGGRKPRLQTLARDRALQCGMGLDAQRCEVFRPGGSAILTMVLQAGSMG